jgi:hypothetical protein
MNKMVVLTCPCWNVGVPLLGVTPDLIAQESALPPVGVLLPAARTRLLTETEDSRTVLTLYS